jgi:hypothetical protein
VLRFRCWIGHEHILLGAEGAVRIMGLGLGAM